MDGSWVRLSVVGVTAARGVCRVRVMRLVLLGGDFVKRRQLRLSSSVREGGRGGESSW